MPKISVIIPLYNKAAHIRRALDSVLLQTEQNFEVIVIDDGSVDDGGRIVKEYVDPRVKYIWQSNSGVSGARNAGVKQALSELVCFLDADDAYKHDFLEIILRLRAEFPGAGAYATEYESRAINGKVHRYPLTKWEGILPNYFRVLLEGKYHLLSASTTAIPVSVFGTVGLFPVGECFGEDLDMWFRIAIRFPIAYATAVGAIYYEDAENRVSNAINTMQFSGYCLIKTANESIANSQCPTEMITYVEKYVDLLRVRAANIYIVSNRRDEARKSLLACRPGNFVMQKAWWFFLSLMPFTILAQVREILRALRKL